MPPSDRTVPRRPVPRPPVSVPAVSGSVVSGSVVSGPAIPRPAIRPSDGALPWRPPPAGWLPIGDDEMPA